MIVGILQVRLHLPESHSLKDKRQVLRSLVTRIRQQFGVAIAEVEEQDQWQIAVLGISCVSNDGQHANSILDHVLRYIEETRPDLMVTQSQTEIISW
jgi:uncharacterized protein YlxP (DUF503 family)